MHLLRKAGTHFMHLLNKAGTHTCSLYCHFTESTKILSVINSLCRTEKRLSDPEDAMEWESSPSLVSWELLL